jgi:hypothetical protein
MVGGVAGAKYTGSLIAAGLAFAFLLEFRSVLQTAILGLGSLIVGIWPYLRNTIWTGDPVFPFLSNNLSPHLVTGFALKSLADDTGASIGHNWGQFLPFVFFAAIRVKNVGFWDFFGPTVFAMAPLICLTFKNTREWRILVLVWLTSSLEIFWASGLTRFLLPVFPIALVCVARGIEGSLRRDWKIASSVSVGIMALMIVSGALGLALYCTEPFLTAIGLRSATAYLEDRSQGYNVAQAINHILAEPESAGKALLFLRHEYYVHVPYLNGDPGTSFEVDPERLKTPEQWKVFLKLKGIAYVVRAPEYPVVIASPLIELEKSGLLIPIQLLQVEDLKGMRIDQVRSTIPVVILKVNF